MLIGARTMIWSNSNSNILPYRAKVEYIANNNSGRQWLEILCNFAFPMQMEAKIYIASFNSSYDWAPWFGDRSNNSYKFGSFINQNRTNISFLYGRGDTNGPVTGGNYQKWMIIRNDIGKLYVDDELITNSGNAGDAVTSMKCTLFTIRDTAGRRGAYCRIGYFNMSNANGWSIRLIPVIDWNYVPCMYDEVSGQFYYNKGTGSFTAGPEI